MDICRDGYAALPGPLCLGVIAKDSTVHLVGNGRASHAGSGDDDVLKAVIAERATLPAPNETRLRSWQSGRVWCGIRRTRER